MFAKLKVALIAVFTVVFAIVALRGVNAHFKLGVGGVLATFSAVTLENWSFIITIAWGLLQIGLLIPDYYRGIKKFFGGGNAETKP